MKKECWFCGRKLMEEAPELGKGWFKCECGATDIELPKVAKVNVTYQGVPWSMWFSGGWYEAKEKGYV